MVFIDFVVFMGRTALSDLLGGVDGRTCWPEPDFT
jgi:hypothetical protein